MGRNLIKVLTMVMTQISIRSQDKHIVLKQILLLFIETDNDIQKKGKQKKGEQKKTYIVLHTIIKD